MKAIRLENYLPVSVFLVIALSSIISAQTHGAGNVKIKSVDGKTREVKLYDGIRTNKRQIRLYRQNGAGNRTTEI